MKNNQKESSKEGLLEALYQRIDGMSRDVPYVWRLKISESEFEALDEAVRKKEKAELLSEEWSLRTVVYLAEWYKRRYDGGAAVPAVLLTSDERKALWNNTGISQQLNLHRFENGDNSWEYSIYVLGGLAIPFELNKADNRTLKALCRLFHGEDDLERFGEAGRAAAFRQSIIQKRSLYEYLRCILNGEFPFSEDDNQARQFVQKVKAANDEVLKSKFRIEWRYFFSVDSPYMSRILHLHLRPEEVGGGLWQYLRFDRAHLWGIATPEKQKRLRVGIRFLNKGQVILPVDWAHPAIIFCNTGNAETGFLAWGVEKCAVVSRVPVESFDALEILVCDDAGKEYLAEKVVVDEWQQVFRVSNTLDEWSDNQQLRQNASALLCTNKCTLLDVSEDEMIYHPIVRSRKLGESAPQLWRHIHTLVRFEDANGIVRTLYNLQGSDQITVKRHHDLLRYADDGTVTCLQWDDELQDFEETQVPLILSREDLIVQHFAARMDRQGADCEQETIPEKIEYKCGGNYTEWTDDKPPTQGGVKLRITEKGRVTLLPVYYFPQAIERDFKQRTIKVGERVCQARIPRDGNPLEPVQVFEEGTEHEKIRLEVWQPTLHKEIIRGNRVVRYVEDGQHMVLPYILKDDVVIHDFNRSGFRGYACGDLSSIYAQEKFSPQNNSHLAALIQANSIPARELDEFAPCWLLVCLSNALDAQFADAVLYHWNYYSDEEPTRVAEYPQFCPDCEIFFQSMKGGSGICIYPYRIGGPDPFGGYDEAKIDLVKCFEVAMEHQVYFFAMLPFRESLQDYVKQLYNPLLEKRKGVLTDDDVRGLKRFAEEFGFSWRDYGISLT